ncbi:cupin domain-containing protein [Saccharopolyspora erythraea]|nr:cupin domain-containing protein [Saccharopolyspora erythraea]
MVTGSTLLHLMPLSAFRADPAEPITAASLAGEGFVHCSPDVPTTLAVANALYREADEPMVAVELDPSRLSAPVRWEAADPAPPPGVSSDVLFPHVYGPIERAAVIGLRYARRDVAGTYLSLETRSRTAEEFDLLPHPEGGWFRRTWASGVEVSRSAEVRPTATSIYFLLAPGRTSEWHAVASDELWFWHRGGPLTLSLGGTGERPGEEPGTVVLGGGAGQVPQAVVPGGTWQRATASATAETLVSCVVSPGFDFADFRTL